MQGGRGRESESAVAVGACAGEVHDVRGAAGRVGRRAAGGKVFGVRALAGGKGEVKGVLRQGWGRSSAGGSRVLRREMEDGKGEGRGRWEEKKSKSAVDFRRSNCYHLPDPSHLTNSEVSLEVVKPTMMSCKQSVFEKNLCMPAPTA